MKPATKRLAGPLVELLGRAGLLQAPVVHDRDPVAHRHRLDLVVGDVDGGRADLLLEALDLAAGLHAQLRVEVGERLVHQEHLRVADQRAAERHALLLAAGELARAAVEQRAELERLGRAVHARSISALGVLRRRSPKARLSRTVICGYSA